MANREALLQLELLRVDGIAPGNNAPKHVKMARHPFLFLRGSAQIFYADIASGLLPFPDGLSKLPVTALMGDCHTSNFGFLTEEGSHGDSVIFSPNDFDDACIGNPGWDLMRFCVSLILCADYCQRSVGQEGKYKGKVAISHDHAASAIDAFLNAYLAICSSALTGRDHLMSAVDAIRPDSKLNKLYLKAQRRAAGGADFETKSALAKAVDVTQLPPKFKRQSDKLIELDEQQRSALIEAFSPYMDDHVLDVTRRVNAGTGSINIDRFYFLIGPKDYASKADLPLCHVVEVKQQRAAAPLYHFPGLHPANRLNPAHLTVMCQRRMQRRPDLVLDEAEWNGSHYLVRSRHHAKVGIDPEDIGIGKMNVKQGGFDYYAQCCGSALALAHCRGDRRSTRLEQRVMEILPHDITALRSIAFDYAEQVRKDCNWLAQQEGSANSL
ncbi:DUF2252 family protein [Aestuariibacter salexigens]|uniref:DUF2252 family protein n=1 Tax=Aestuariibacter salexigens TaxID=226010 RepID=UPI00041FB9DF|nr:DUF2252 family protein [Aestuariibacter salexigens]